MREIVDSCLFGDFTQGSVFNGVRMNGVDHYGVVITARCDIEQSKVDKLNFLVATPLSQWWGWDGREVVYYRSIKKIEQEVLKILNRHGVSGDVLDDYPDKIFVDLVKESSLSDSEELSKLFSINSSNITKFDYPWVKGNKKSVLKDLFSQRLNGYYFIENIDPFGRGEGYVIDLRMPMTIPIEFAYEAKAGIEDQAVIRRCKCHDIISIPSGEIVMFLSYIKSPYIEHILQSFTNTFSRIGLQDIDQGYINEKIGDYS